MPGYRIWTHDPLSSRLAHYRLSHNSPVWVYSDPIPDRELLPRVGSQLLDDPGKLVAKGHRGGTAFSEMALEKKKNNKKSKFEISTRVVALSGKHTQLIQLPDRPFHNFKSSSSGDWQKCIRGIFRFSLRNLIQEFQKPSFPCSKYTSIKVWLCIFLPLCIFENNSQCNMWQS